MKDTTAAVTTPPILVHLITLLEAHRPAFRQERTYQRALALLWGMLWSLARHTLTQSLLALGLVDADWSAFYRLFSHQRIDIASLQQHFFLQTLAHVRPDQPYVLATDGVWVPRTSRRMPGVGWRKAPNTAPFRPGLSLGQRFGALHWLPLLVHGYTRAIPVISYPCFTPKARPAAALPQKEWAGALAALQTIRQALDAAGRTTQPIILLADGSYDVVAFWCQLPHDTYLLARTAKNRALRDLPPVPDGTRRGRPQRYGPHAPAPSAWIQQRRGWRHLTRMVRGQLRRMRYRVEGPFLRQPAWSVPLYLVIMGGTRYRRHGRAKRRDPVPVLVNAQAQPDGRWGLPLPVEVLVVWLWQRWEVEVTHRELKSGFGVGELQCWHPRSVSTSIQWGMWAYGVCVLAAYRSWGICGGPRPPGRWWRGSGRWSFSTLWRALRLAWWQQPPFRASHPRTPSDWGKKALWVDAMVDAVVGAARL